MWYTVFDSAFWLTIAGIVSGVVGLSINACLKSRCKLVKCWGCEIDRDVELEDREALQTINTQNSIHN